ncbi:MAG: helicase HerA-like domain-containing protein [Hyphomicrobiaceae bacterium]
MPALPAKRSSDAEAGAPEPVASRSVSRPLEAAFEHSITWEDDLWRADPVDVEVVHAKARRLFADQLAEVAAGRGGPGRILLFHGQSGAGKTHLIRALRTSAHRAGKAYFGYAQMTPDVASYADYYLRRLVNALEKPYDPDNGGESALKRLTRAMLADVEGVDAKKLETLRDGKLKPDALARLVHDMADDILAAPRFDGQELDVNIVRALLYLERADPRIDQRVRTYLQGRPLNEMSREAVAALDPTSSESRAFDVIEALGRIMWTVEKAALVFCIDQVEDLRNFADPEERFQKAVGNLMQIANLLPNAIIIVSVLEEFYGQCREALHRSYIDRLERLGPVALYESRTAEEARQIVWKRLGHAAEAAADGELVPTPESVFGPEVYEELAGLSTRRLLELAQQRLSRSHDGEPNGEGGDAASAAVPPAKGGGFISALAAALFGDDAADDVVPAKPFFAPDYRELWQRFASASEAEMPAEDRSFVDVLSASLTLAIDEWGPGFTISVAEAELGDDLPALDLKVAHANGYQFDARIYLCNRPTQGGGLKRQLDKVLATMGGKACTMLRASDFPPNKKNQTAQAFRKFREQGGRSILVPISDWERLMMAREFHAHHRHDPGFAEWFRQSRLVSSLPAIVQILRLDLYARPLPSVRSAAIDAASAPAPSENLLDPRAQIEQVRRAFGIDGGVVPDASALPVSGDAIAIASGQLNADWTGWGVPAVAAADSPADDALPIEMILDENADNAHSIFAGRDTKSQKPVTLNKGVMKRHSAVLGGSGSGKTTLALSLIEQLLQRGIPAVLIDRKGDLCSYANPDTWRAEGETHDRLTERERLGDAIDVAVYTPGRSSGRPISITLLPNGINELPDHEQQLLANLSAAALGDMLHLKNSATHQKQSGTLSVALRILGARSAREVTLGDLILLLEEEDPELTELTQRMDPSGKLRRDLVAQLDSLRHRNAALFEGGGESLSMESFLGLGPYARPNRTRLSVIYTGFLGDNENILFWVSQFLSEALRFCQRNPNDELQAVVMFDEADLYIPANSKPATAEPLQSLLKRARSAGLGIMLATQSPGDLDYKSRDQITSWFIGRVREDTALRKLKAAFQSESGLDPAAVLPHQTVGEFHLVQEGLVRPIKAQRSLILAEQVPFDRIEQLARETKGQDEKQLRLFG